MNKIVAAFDGLRFSEATLRQAIDLCRDGQAHLVGVFLHEFYQQGYLFAEQVMVATMNGKDIIEAVRRQDDETYRASVRHFGEACAKAGVGHTIHDRKETALKDLVRETLFADLLVIDPRDTFSSLQAAAPGWFVHVLLRETHCPVLAVAKKEQRIEHAVFLYDGEASSIHAMKMFSYLFPAFREKKVDILTVKTDTTNLHVPHHELVHEWVKRHYPAARFRTYEGNSSQLITLVQEQEEGCIVVAGAYERSRVSMLFRQSLADDLVNQVKAPVFIAHP